MLTQHEIDTLKKQHEGYAIEFSVFCREKLLNREAATLSKPIEEGIRQQLTNLLKLSGSLLMLSKKTSSQILVSEGFERMATNVREVVLRAVYSVNEIAYSQSLIMKLDSIVAGLERTLKEEAKSTQDGAFLKVILSKVDDLKNALNPFLELYKMTKLRHDR